MGTQFLLNNIYNAECIESMKKLPSESIDLVIADPPYWKVVGEKWDYQWRTEEDYVAWSLQWMREVSRILRKGGSFYCFGYFRTLAQLIPYFDDLGLELRQQIIVDKGMRSVSGRATRKYKMFPNVTESILFIVKDNKKFVKTFLKDRQKAAGLTAKQINEALGVKSNGGGMWSIYTGNNVCEQFPTKELWGKLAEILHFDLSYEKVSQTFNAQMGFTDVWRDIDFYEEKRYHPTQKPIKLIKRLICASSNKGDIVLDPFVGGGSTPVVATLLERNFLGFEVEKKYYEAAMQRIEELKSPGFNVADSDFAV
ncbi:MAG: site-specific DNA-methyltransferase [Muribaculaceae bacterium]|nr:site-specific DNA-methyltransferase [Muribaculaceae bacterium]MDE6093820.1 site-specific DNA-methyltransferase [Muribaculaceae bacterium]MDE6344947.1 site-specific DNA-methyltransferase [Muribaculaceae bacterium]MDE6609558.1 site-specific DNA-methyltransferase [Muribaculaceae bacterium]